MMLDELKLKLKELAELRRDIQMSNEYILERKAEYEATEAYKSYEKAINSRAELQKLSTNLVEDINDIVMTIMNIPYDYRHTYTEVKSPVEGVRIKKIEDYYVDIDSDLSQYLK
jgi:uncharacterized protein YjiS (DUF1127 family)